MSDVPRHSGAYSCGRRSDPACQGALPQSLQRRSAQVRLRLGENGCRPGSCDWTEHKRGRRAGPPANIQRTLRQCTSAAASGAPTCGPGSSGRPGAARQDCGRRAGLPAHHRRKLGCGPGRGGGRRRLRAIASTGVLGLRQVAIEAREHGWPPESACGARTDNAQVNQLQLLRRAAFL